MTPTRPAELPRALVPDDTACRLGQQLGKRPCAARWWGLVTTGVVLMAYGTPRAPEEIEPYYTDIRRGRAPTPEQLADLTRRYEAIGGISPLARLTEAQRDALQAALDERAPGELRRRARPQARRPQGRGRRGHARRRRRRADRRAGAGPALLVDVDRRVPRPGPVRPPTPPASRSPVSRAGPWSPPTSSSSPPRSAAGWPTMPERTRVVFTAHSLPQRILATGDPYPDELRSTATAVAGAVGLVEATSGPSAGSRPAARRSRGSGPTSSPSSTSSPPPTTSTACSCARAASSPTTSRCSTTSTSRPAAGPTGSAWPSSGRPR